MTWPTATTKTLRSVAFVGAMGAVCTGLVVACGDAYGTDPPPSGATVDDGGASETSLPVEAAVNEDGSNAAEAGIEGGSSNCPSGAVICEDFEQPELGNEWLMVGEGEATSQLVTLSTTTVLRSFAMGNPSRAFAWRNIPRPIKQLRVSWTMRLEEIHAPYTELLTVRVKTVPEVAIFGVVVTNEQPKLFARPTSAATESTDLASISTGTSVRFVMTLDLVGNTLSVLSNGRLDQIAVPASALSGDLELRVGITYNESEEQTVVDMDDIAVEVDP